MRAVFRQEYDSAVPAFRDMKAETHYGPGTAYSPWNEDSLYKGELMSGFKDSAEFVFPVSIDVMKLPGHRIRSRLNEKQLLAVIINEVADIQFQRVEDAKVLIPIIMSLLKYRNESNQTSKFLLEKPFDFTAS